jgi:hypothetical protein
MIQFKKDWKAITLALGLIILFAIPADFKLYIYKPKPAVPSHQTKTKHINKYIPPKTSTTSSLQQDKTTTTQKKFDIFGESEFETDVTGYLEIIKDTVFGEKRTSAYFTITEATNKQFLQNIENGIENGNGVNIKKNDTYLLNLGCFDEKIKILGAGSDTYLDDRTQKALKESSKQKPIKIRLYFEKHLGYGCICCNIAEKIRLIN